MEYINIGDEEIIMMMIIVYKYFVNFLLFQGIEIVLVLIECFGVLLCDIVRKVVN